MLPQYGHVMRFSPRVLFLATVYNLLAPRPHPDLQDFHVLNSTAEPRGAPDLEHNAKQGPPTARDATKRHFRMQRMSL